MASDQALTETAVTVAEPRADVIPWVNSVFEQPWWLDSVAPGRWDAAVVHRGDEVVARLPYTVRRRYGRTTIVQPHLTQTLGPWLAPTTCKYARRLEAEKRLLGQLIEALPPFDFFRMNFSPALTNWLPFYWAGFEATVRYTYRIEDLTDLDRVRGEFQEAVRRGIRKAQGALEVDHDYPLEHLLRLNAETFARQGLRPPYSDAFVRRLDAACAARGARRVLGAIDAHGRAHAALYVAWDEHTLYPLINARDPELQSFGSNTLLYWEAIRLASEVSRVFDFEGSMLEPIEHFVRAFGGRQTPYFSVWKAGVAARSVLAVRSARRALGRRARTRLGREPRAVAQRRHALPLVAAGACAVGLVVVGWLALDVPAARDRDVAILHGFTGLDRSTVDNGLVVAGRMVDPVPYALGGLACIAVAIARGRRLRAIAVAAVLVASGLAAQALKHAFAEQRYAPWLGFGQIDAASWPSGHATAVMTLALCAVLVAPPAWRGVVALLGGAFAVGVAYATLALAWHYPSDVLAGFLLAGLWVSLAVAVLQHVEPEVAGGQRALPWEPLVAMGGLGALVAAALVAAASEDVAQYATARSTLVLGALTIAALALALVASVVVSE